MVEPENKSKSMIRFYWVAKQKRKQPGRNGFCIRRGFIAFLLSLFSFRFWKPFFWRKIIGIRIPHTIKKVVEGTNARGITKRKTAENCIQRVFFEQSSLSGNKSNLKLNRKQIGTQHTGRKSWLGSVFGIAVSHKLIHKR